MEPANFKCVLLADRHHDLSEGLRGLLETTFDSVVMVANEASLLATAGRLQPDVAVVDLSLARHQDLLWLRSLRHSCPGLTLIVISVHDEANVCRSALEAGADGFVVKRAIATDLLPAIDLALERKRELLARTNEKVGEPQKLPEENSGAK